MTETQRELVRAIAKHPVFLTESGWRGPRTKLFRHVTVAAVLAAGHAVRDDERFGRPALLPLRPGRRHYPARPRRIS